MPIITLKVTTTCNLPKHTLIYSTLHLELIVVCHHLCLQSMSTKRSRPNTGDMAQTVGFCGSWQWCDNNSVRSDNCSWTVTGNDSRFGKHTNQYYPLHGYGYPPAKQPLPGTWQFYQHSPFNKTPSSQPTTSTCPGFPSYELQWRGYDPH